MKITQSWKRNTPNTQCGESITVSVTYSSLDQSEVYEIEKRLMKGVAVMESDEKGPIEERKEHVKPQYDANGNKFWNCPRCGKYIDRYNTRIPWEEVKYCSYCGQGVTWNV